MSKILYFYTVIIIVQNNQNLKFHSLNECDVERLCTLNDDWNCISRKQNFNFHLYLSSKVENY